MFDFLLQNLPSLVVGLAVAALLLGVARKLWRDKQQGRSSCGCGCRGCPSAEMCHPSKDNPTGRTV